MRQGKWRRAGIALSILWLLIGGYWGNSTGLHRGDFAVAAFRHCTVNSASPGNAGGPCLMQFEKDYAQAIRGHWRDAFAVGVLPILIAWLMAYGLTRRKREIGAA